MQTWHTCDSSPMLLKGQEKTEQYHPTLALQWHLSYLSRVSSLTKPESKTHKQLSSSTIASTTLFAYGHGELYSTARCQPELMFNCERPRPSCAARIPPSDMQTHRISYRMLGPCCLCPLMDINKPDFVEAAIYMATDGEQAGQFVASCAKDECGYFGSATNPRRL